MLYAHPPIRLQMNYYYSLLELSTRHISGSLSNVKLIYTKKGYALEAYWQGNEAIEQGLQSLGSNS